MVPFLIAGHIITCVIVMTPYHTIPPHPTPPLLSHRYLQLTLDQYVEQDYTIVYFHYGLNSSNKPNFSIMLQGYKELARK